MLSATICASVIGFLHSGAAALPSGRNNRPDCVPTFFPPQPDARKENTPQSKLVCRPATGSTSYFARTHIHDSALRWKAKPQGCVRDHTRDRTESKLAALNTRSCRRGRREPRKRPPPALPLPSRLKSVRINTRTTVASTTDLLVVSAYSRISTEIPARSCRPTCDHHPY